MPKKIGIVGVPPRDLIEQHREPGDEVIDLDMPRSDVRKEDAEQFVPRVYCATLRTVAANALTLDLDLIIASVGEGKCDGARYIFEKLGDKIGAEIIAVRRSGTEPRGYPVCTSGLPLREKIDLIVKSVADNLSDEEKSRVKPSEPVAGFWGVPPHDYSILDLFPAATHVFGWTRCMENGTPADLEIETYVEPGLPTVFFAQAFCAKNALARTLASMHNGLYVEVDEVMTRSAAAKIEAFLELGGIRR
ncbi:MAG TPA: hypothetical protein VMX35_14740 [Acidobacteriota bacterium]|nr:hypothetical protein [Acidobacteriota bacterium]